MTLGSKYDSISSDQYARGGSYSGADVMYKPRAGPSAEDKPKEAKRKEEKKKPKKAEKPEPSEEDDEAAEYRRKLEEHSTPSFIGLERTSKKGAKQEPPKPAEPQPNLLEIFAAEPEPEPEQKQQQQQPRSGENQTYAMLYAAMGPSIILPQTEPAQPAPSAAAHDPAFAEFVSAPAVPQCTLLVSL